ncbi:NHLP bacteriocin export ABC transporter permease/ATPase subunit [Lentzea alba]|uniref:NHLP bacteriocin export ABC transporter permease/ATPase subunit n=1 Tax=Lentzea alba TaxID=2714351 RepID=UPI0039BF68E8
MTHLLKDQPTGTPSLWLVSAGTAELFAVAGNGPWHHVGQVEAGTVLLSVTGYDLVLRPDEDALLRELSLTELSEPLIAAGLGQGLTTVAEHLGAEPPRDLARHVDALRDWITAALDIAIGRRLHERERQADAHRDEDRAVAERATRSLRAVLSPAEQAVHAGTILNAGPVLAACALVANDLGLTLTPPPRHTTSGAALVEEIAAYSGVRTRVLTLTGRWWREDTGPLVGRREDTGDFVALLWRRGGYQVHDPATDTGERVNAQIAANYAAQAVQFYRPLADGPRPKRRLLLHGVRGNGRDLALLVLSALVAVAINLLIPVATGQVLGRLVPSAQSGLIVQAGAMLIAAAVAAGAFGVVQNFTLLRIEGRFEAALQSAVWDRMLRLPVAFFRRFGIGELAFIALGVGYVRQAVSTVSATIVHSTIVAVLNFALLFLLDVRLALLATVLLLVAAAVFTVLGVRQTSWQAKSVRLGHEIMSRVFQTLRGLPKLRTADATRRAFANWAAAYAAQKEIDKRAGRYQNIVAVFSSTYPILCTVAFFAVIAGPVRNDLSATAYLSFNASFAIMLAATIQVATAVTTSIEAFPLVERIVPVLTEPREVRAGAVDPGEISGEITVNRLTFSYAENMPPVLDDISFHVGAGEFVAIVGPSGCGKSTLLRLLLGLEQPATGTVLYDGKDLATLDVVAVRRQCGVVLQQAMPSEGSMLDAITGGRGHTEQDAWTAAEMAGLRADIEAMPMGMHTVITDASALSGGQRQRVTIASALIHRPRVLFLDEATSALDNETQRVVAENTRRLNATRIVVAHRLSTVQDADRVVVLDAGKVVQVGSPAELLADPNGLFHRLARRQLTDDPS